MTNNQQFQVRNEATGQVSVTVWNRSLFSYKVFGNPTNATLNRISNLTYRDGYKATAVIDQATIDVFIERKGANQR